MEPNAERAGRLGRALADALEWRSAEHRHPGDRPVDDPVDAVRSALGRARPASAGGAYVRVLGDAALAEAAAQAQAADRRPLAGVALAVKDLVAVAGQSSGCGSAQRDAAGLERADAAIVAQLRGLGAIPVGLAALHEFAFGVTGLNEHTGSPLHPTDAERIPGGSSSGSAVAVATGSALLSVVTDTGGSARIPAALCGVVGFKPAYGEYPTDGVHPLAPSLDHVGLMAASVDGLRYAHGALGHAVGAPRVPTRVGYVAEELDAADPPVRARVRAALGVLEDAGAVVVPTAWPGSDRGAATATAIMFSEAAAVHRRALTEHPDRFSDDVRGRLEAGLRIDAPTYVAAKQQQQLLRREVEAVLDGVDAVLSPTVPVLPPLLSAASDSRTSARLVHGTQLLNVVGAPALTLPLVLPGALAVGLQIVARRSAALLDVAAGVDALLGSS